MKDGCEYCGGRLRSPKGRCRECGADLLAPELEIRPGGSFVYIPIGDPALAQRVRDTEPGRFVVRSVGP